MSTFNNSKGMNLPAGINIQHTSFGQQQQGTYNPTFQSENQLKIDTNAQHRKGKPGGGWDDDDIQPTLSTGNGSGGLIKPTYVSNTTTTTTTTTNTTSTNGTGGSFSFVSKSTKPTDLELADVDDKFLQNHEYEHKLILDTILPGGARLKQADAVLSTFVKAAETLNVPIVGSIIISKLKSPDTVFVTKARAIYDIETLVKKLGKYFDFFKHNLTAIKGINFAQTEGNSSNVSQLNTILQSVVKFIEDPQSATAKPITQSQPYSPNIQNNTANLLELDEPATQKKNEAFGFIKSNQGGSQNPPSTDTSPKKANAFGFISKTSAPEADTNIQTQQQQQQQKKNAFGFIKSDQSQTTQTTQPQQQQQTKNTTQSRYEFLDMDFAGNSANTTNNQNTTPKIDVGNLYATSNTKPSNGFGGGLSGIDFGSNSQQQGGFGGYGSGPTQPYGNGFGAGTNTYNAGGYSQNPMGFNQNSVGLNQTSNMGFNQNSSLISSQNSNIGYNQNAGGFNQNVGGSFNYNYQGLQTQLNGMNLGDVSNETEKQKKQQQEQEAKFFDFVKF